MTRLWLTLAAAGILAASPVAPAEATASLDADDVKMSRFEIGGSASAILPIVSEDVPTVVMGGGPRVTINVAPWMGIELLAEALGPVEDQGTFGVYMTQVKVPVSRSAGGGRTLSLTVGAAGAASYQVFPETRRVRFDGSTVVHPGYRRFRAVAPNSLSVGMSGRHVLSRLAAGTWDLQGLIGAVGGIAVRASVGVSFGIGGYR